MGSRGPLQLSGIDQVREGDFRSERGAIRFQVGHSTGNPVNTAGQLIEQGKVGVDLFRSIVDIAPYQVFLASMIEQLPRPEDQLDPLGLPRPKLTYSHSDYIQGGWDAAVELHTQILEAVGATNINHFDQLGGVGHLMCTTRMGDDPETSVADSFGRAHDHANMFIAGASLFPTSGTANPTLTIAALSLRTADHLKTELGLA
jgi:choline dehydrogenase-like flavoprotein